MSRENYDAAFNDRSAYAIPINQAVERGLVKAERGELKSKPCPHCGKQLYRYCVLSKQLGSFLTQTYELCDCAAAKEEAEKEEAERKAAAFAEKQRKAQEQMQERIRKAYLRSEMPERWKNYTLDKFETCDADTQNAKGRITKFVAWFTEAYKSGTTNRNTNGLMLLGNSGTGKTHLAAAALNEIIRSNPGIPVIGSTMGEMLGKLKATYDENATTAEEEVLRLYTQIPLLLIDDLGSEQITEWAIDRIFAIVNGRYNAALPTIITSNYATDKALAKRLTPPSGDTTAGAKIVDRLAEMCSRIKLDGQSYRSRRSESRCSVDPRQTHRMPPVCGFKTTDDRLHG